MKLILACALVCGAAASDEGLGDRLLRSFLAYEAQPLTVSSALSSGWALDKASCRPQCCIEGLGSMYVNASTGITVANPTSLYFAENGQISGMGTEIFNHSAPLLVAEGYFIEVGGAYRVTVGFRDADTVCSGSAAYKEPIGTKAVINPHQSPSPLPLSAHDAQSMGYHTGSCFDAMGCHYLYDVVAHPAMSWNASNLMPVVPMFATPTGRLNAIFFTAYNDQISLGSKAWDAIGALNNPLMCSNTCDNDCTFSGTKVWTTMHWFLHDPNTIKHPSDYTCMPVPPAPFGGVGCCPNASIS